MQIARSSIRLGRIVEDFLANPLLIFQASHGDRLNGELCVQPTAIPTELRQPKIEIIHRVSSLKIFHHFLKFYPPLGHFRDIPLFFKIFPGKKF